MRLVVPLKARAVGVIAIARAGGVNRPVERVHVVLSLNARAHHAHGSSESKPAVAVRRHALLIHLIDAGSMLLRADLKAVTFAGLSD